MGDRVSLTAYVREEGAKLFAESLGESVEDMRPHTPGWMVYEYDEVDGGGETECRDAAEAGCEFFAVHGAHYMYPGAWMCGHEGKFYLITATGYGSPDDPMVPLRCNEGFEWTIQRDDLDYCMRGLGLILHMSMEAKVQGFGAPDPTSEDFSEMLAGFFAHGLEDTEVLERLDPDTAGEMLVALARKMMSDPPDPEVDIQNHYPDQDAAVVTVGNTEIKIWRDEEGDTHIHVCDPDGNYHDMVLGREGYTEKL